MEIKDLIFKGRVVSRNVWIQGSLIFFDDFKKGIRKYFIFQNNHINPQSNSAIFYEVEFKSIKQYIGRKDKNREMIFTKDKLVTSNDDPKFDIWTEKDFGVTEVYWNEEFQRFDGTKWFIEDADESVYGIEFVSILKD